MSTKCTHCGFHHGLDDADLARCRNARDLGIKLRRVLTIRAVEEPATIEEAVQRAAERRGR